MSSFNPHRKVFLFFSCFFNVFRKQAQQWHPDNFQNDEESRKKAEKKFIDIAAAKEVLTDPGK